MRQSQLFTKTLKNISAEETSKNAQLLTRGGFIYKNSAGVYSYLPLGWRVIEKINKIVREEINAIGGVEIFMPALLERKYFEATGRFDLPVGFDVFAKNTAKGGGLDKKAPYSLGWTHEEVLTTICSKYISSYKDLPVALYQIQTKFRNEERAKSGLLRGREFLMKDLYSFHISEEDLFDYYEKVKLAYLRIFNRCGLYPLYALAGGGEFTMSNTNEFQIISEVGEDEVLYCNKCRYCENSEISKLKQGDECLKCDGKILKENTIEVGNIFPLGTKYSTAFGLEFNDEKGNKKPVVMGSYGIGISRLMGTIVEIYNDDNGIIWPKNVAPFFAHLVYLSSNDFRIKAQADEIYKVLQKANIEVLYDDRDNVSYGEKLKDADLIGIPVRLLVSERTVAQNSVELKARNKNDITLCLIKSLVNSLKTLV